MKDALFPNIKTTHLVFTIKSHKYFPHQSTQKYVSFKHVVVMKHIKFVLLMHWPSHTSTGQLFSLVRGNGECHGLECIQCMHTNVTTSHVNAPTGRVLSRPKVASSATHGQDAPAWVGRNNKIVVSGLRSTMAAPEGTCCQWIDSKQQA